MNRSLKTPREKLLGALMISALVLGACSSSSGPPSTTVAPTLAPTTAPAPLPKGETLTTGQAARLSRVFFTNLDKGGGDVVVDVPFGTQSSVRIEAKVDWKNHRGQGTIVTTFNDGRPAATQPLWWYAPNDLQQGAIVTTVPGLPEALDAQGQPGVKYVARPISENSALDITLRFLDRLSSDRAENPILLRQSDVAFLGTETVDGTECDRIRFGDKGTQYWIATTGGQLRKVSARLSGLASPTVFVFDNLGTTAFADPGPTEVVDSRDIAELYNRLTKRS